MTYNKYSKPFETFVFNMTNLLWKVSIDTNMYIFSLKSYAVMKYNTFPKIWITLIFVLSAKRKTSTSHINNMFEFRQSNYKNTQYYKFLKTLNKYLYAEIFLKSSAIWKRWKYQSVPRKRRIYNRKVKHIKVLLCLTNYHEWLDIILTSIHIYI